MKQKLKSLRAWFGEVKKGEVLVETETGKQFVVVGKGSSTAHLKVKDINKRVYEFHNCFLHPYCEGEAP
jgi:hypothetical protein